jgi:hypothetical protein
MRHIFREAAGKRLVALTGQRRIDREVDFSNDHRCASRARAARLQHLFVRKPPLSVPIGQRAFSDNTLKISEALRRKSSP